MWIHNLTGGAWGEAVRAWTRAIVSGKWNAHSIENAMDSILLADLTLKETSVSNDEQILTTMILSISA